MTKTPPSQVRAAWRAALCSALVAGLLAACGSGHEDLRQRAGTDHYADGRFHNLDRDFALPDTSDVLAFQWSRLTRHMPAPTTDITPLVPDLGWLQGNRAEPSATWIGHATVLVQIAGLNVLTDPQFSQRASPVQWMGPKRLVPPAMSVAELPDIDVVLISHSHFDHLDEGSIRALAAKGDPLFLVPLGLEPLLREWGAHRVQALDWNEQTAVTGRHGVVKFDCVPARHWSRRGLFDRDRALWAGWMMSGPDFRVYFAGDTGWDESLFNALGERFAPVDMALLPVGAYEPRDFMRNQHINPAEAVKVFQALGARRGLGIHWATFDLSDEAPDAPRRVLPAALLAAGLPENAIALTRPGETLRPRAPVSIDLRGKSPRYPKRQWAKGEPR
ncbi:MBL fold metallo-hydrolase [Derxia gummosa]|uniref:MBL fold metallo-hydrolase n=1 Tax=Derxia gummosa DSM 723 TaxID=1121388 RepID=A0A8B6X9D8_9BURK|nr:MBL fold metallo-hydrolase [Derxia gummosa]